MLMQAQPVYDAFLSVTKNLKGRMRPRVIYMAPQGRTFHQQMARELACEEDLIILCGHYEGIDQRVLDTIVTDYVSIGDYVLTGGELPAMVMIDAVSRMVPGVLGNEDSGETESFSNYLLEYPQYSRPEEWNGQKVPEVLLSGNHEKVEEWRLTQSLERTKELRPDLYEKWAAENQDYFERLRRREARKRQKEERLNLLRLIKDFHMTLTGLRGYNEAIITKGGISVKEIDPGTMESKLIKNLYFAGEVLDLDAVTGGYNLQIAWSTGYLAGISAGQDKLFE